MDSSDKIEKLDDGIYAVTNPGDGALDRTIELDGKVLYRFMDFLYTSNKNLEELNASQVKALCKARAERMPQPSNKRETAYSQSPNQVVRRLVQHLIRELKPSNILEIGAGANPALEEPYQGQNYVVTDMDEGTIFHKDDYNAKFKPCKFGEDETRLPVETSQIDMIIAIFVFHFRIYDYQIKEIHRCLSENGVLIANVYRRSRHSRDTLIAQFTALGLHHSSVLDTISDCFENHYWIIAKNKRLIDSTIDIIERYQKNFSPIGPMPDQPQTGETRW